MKNVMIDIESLSTQKNATILSIGAVKFDAESLGDEFYFELKPEQDRHVDPSTALWWAQQSAAFNDGLVKYGLREVLHHLAGFLDPDCFDKYSVQNTMMTANFKGNIWANSPSFDCDIIGDAYKQFDFEPPWKFYREMDVRTIKSFLDKPETPEFVGQKHHALDDAKHQARLVQAFLKKTGLQL